MKQPTVKDRVAECVGDLDAYLAAKRAEPVSSFADIAYDIRTWHGVSVSAEAVRQWCLDLKVIDEEGVG